MRAQATYAKAALRHSCRRVLMHARPGEEMEGLLLPPLCTTGPLEAALKEGIWNHVSHVNHVNHVSSRCCFNAFLSSLWRARCKEPHLLPLCSALAPALALSYPYIFHSTFCVAGILVLCPSSAPSLFFCLLLLLRVPSLMHAVRCTSSLELLPRPLEIRPFLS
jgi:hypothetical protein